jgi:KAP family P-loop domain/TIR domain
MAQPATTDSLRLAISYHVEDAEWKNRLVFHLRKQNPAYQILEHQLTDSSSGPDAETRVAIQGAKVLVLVVSQAYMRSTWIKDEQGAALFKYGRGPTILALLARSTDEKELSRLPAHYVPLNATPLEAVSAARQEGTLVRAANAITQLLQKKSGSPHDVSASDVAPEEVPAQYDTGTRPIRELSRFARSNEVENALRRARRLATISTPRAVTSAALLFGLAEGGRAEADYFRTPQFLWDELTKGGDFQYTKMLTEEFAALATRDMAAALSLESPSDEAEFVTVNVVEIFKVAQLIVRRTSSVSSQIGARHLLAAMLVSSPNSGPTGASRRLATIVGDLEAFRRRFYNFIVNSIPDEDHAAWKNVLIDLEVSPASATPKQQPDTSPHADDYVLDPQPSVAGFMADDWTGRDLLGITRDVNALASLVAAYKVEPPLSIGLFGDWGSGKSHFMRQMRKRVELLSKKARDSGKPQNELGYYKNIVQIEFNAWHYIEGNLWASLVDHIFANLKLSEQEPRKYADERRDKLLQKLGLQEELKKKIDSEVEEREAELRKVEERKQQAEVELSSASTQLANFRRKAEASLETLTVTVNLSAEEKELLSRLGVDASGVVKGAELRKKYDELKGVGNRIKAQWQLFRSGRGVVSRYVLSALAVMIVIGGPLLLKLDIFPPVPTKVLTVVGFLATFLTAIKPVRDQFNKTLKALEKHDQEVERERLKRVTELESEVNALGSEVVAAKLKSETVGKEIDQLKVDIATTSSTRLLAEFIEDRAAASDYRRHLGLLALIRRDFEKLRDLFDQQRQEESAGNEVSDDKKINRIVLYIDDLDRCPPDRVVQVLQAIHLLLAFPLFVVVVGVDSRWVTRSLQQNYEWLGENDGEIANGDKKEAVEDRDEERGRGTGATPHDYLEKIFQIPFWLKPMNDDACVEYLDGLTKEATHSRVLPVAHKEEPQVSVSLQPDAAKAAVAETPLPPSVGSLEKQAEAIVKDPIQSAASFSSAREENAHDPIDLAAHSLTFTSFEVDYMKQLVPLIGRSPRAVKRFLNCYRLIKVGLTPAEFAEFVAEGKSSNYKAVMILLGVITGAPTVSSFMLDKLKTWQSPERTVVALFNTLALEPEVQQQPDAERLFRFYQGHDFGKFSDVLLEDMLKFAPRVSRFSFRVNRTGLAKPLVRQQD